MKQNIRINVCVIIADLEDFVIPIETSVNDRLIQSAIRFCRAMTCERNFYEQ